MSAPREVVPIVLTFIRPKSILDVGCGTGTWLKAFEEAGVQDYLGVDGVYVDRSKLRIPSSKFIPFDISKPMDLGRKFDLVVSLEVAEHLAPQEADIIVESLVRHGETILFSAAIPGQGGQNHLNEQWPEYWQKKFMKHGYHFHDVIRSLIWNNDNIEWWYRQNIFLISKEKPQAELREFVHKTLYTNRTQYYEQYVENVLAGRYGVMHSLKILFRALKDKMFGQER